jgi:hypothetical protein
MTALDLLDDLHALYVRAGENETVKSILNKAFFTRLWVDGGKVTDQQPKQPFDLMSEAYAVYIDREATRRAGVTRAPTGAPSGMPLLTADRETAVTPVGPAQWSHAQTDSRADLPGETGPC